MATTPTAYAGISYDSATKTYSIATTALTADINSVIASAGIDSVIQFGVGVYRLTETLRVQRDDISVRGLGTENTILQLDSSLTGDGIVFKGGLDPSWFSTVQNPASLGAHSVTVSNATGLRVGDVVMISQANDAGFLASGLYDNVAASPYMSENPLRETMVEVSAINGNTISLTQELAYAITGGLVTVQRLNVLRDVSLSDLSITYDLPGTPDPDSFTNALPAFENADAVAFNYTKDVDIHNIAIKNAGSIALEVRNALNANVDGLTVQGAWNKGGDGNGYGLHIAGSFYGTFDNLNITDVRHAVLFSSWNAEVGNYVHVLNTNRDINYHGSDDHNNTVIVDQVIYEGSPEHAWALISPGSTMHPYTDISRNTNLFGYAVGGTDNDDVRGWDSGAQLYGREGHDILTGGAGDDIISGDIGNDTLTGGAGSDIFLRNFGDGQDVITDFQTGTGGDVLAFKGYGGLKSIGDLSVSQVGSDTLVTLYNSYDKTETILLKNVLWSSMTAGNIVFQTPAATALDTSIANDKDFIRWGDNSDDIVRGNITRLSSDDLIDLGTGRDMLQIVTTSFTLDTGLYNNLKGIDVIDVTSGNTPRVIVSQSFMNTTDAGKLTIVYGENGLDRLTATGLSSSSEVILEGAGTVNLADNVANVVTVTDLTLGAVNGLRGADTFIVRGYAPAILNGGDGNDVFAFETDTLTAQSKIAGGNGSDTIRFLTTAKISADDMNGVSGIEKMEFMSLSGNSITLNGTPFLFSGSASGLTYLKTDVSALTSATTCTLGANINMAITGATPYALSFVIADSSARLTGGDEKDTITGSTGNDRFSGGGGDDLLIGGLGNDYLTGGAGRDTFQITLGEGKDTITDFQAGAGGDIIKMIGYYNNISFADIVLTQEGADTRVTLNPKEYIILKNTLATNLAAENFMIDNAVIFNVTMTTSTGADRLISGGGADILNAYASGLSSSDVIDMGTGTDILKFMTSKMGFDFTTLAMATGVEIIDLTSTTVSNLVISRDLGAGSATGELTLQYGAGTITGLDTSRVDAANTVTLQGGAGTIWLADGVNNRITLAAGNNGTVLHGGNGADYMRVRGGTATIDGHDGNDTFSIGGAGTWALYGGAGDDVFQFSSTAYLKSQTVDGGAGGLDELRLYDAANLYLSNLANVTGFERIVFYGASNNIKLTDTLFESRLEVRGSASGISLFVDMNGVSNGKTLVINDNLSSVSLQSLSGRQFNIETTSKTIAVVSGGDANETFTGGSASDTFYGNNGNDTLYGNNGDDKIYGGAGNDVLVGGRGADILTGGTGDDTFVFNATTDLGDTIKDFRHDGIIENDVLDLTALFNANNLAAVSQGDAFAQGYVSFAQSGSATNVMFDRDGIGTKYAAVLVAALDGVLASGLSHDSVIV